MAKIYPAAVTSDSSLTDQQLFTQAKAYADAKEQQDGWPSYVLVFDQRGEQLQLAIAHSAGVLAAAAAQGRAMAPALFVKGHPPELNDADRAAIRSAAVDQIKAETPISIEDITTDVRASVAEQLYQGLDMPQLTADVVSQTVSHLIAGDNAQRLEDAVINGAQTFVLNGSEQLMPGVEVDFVKVYEEA